MNVTDLLPVILGAGGVAFIGTVFQFVQAVRNSAETREAKAIQNLERWRNEADQRALDCIDSLRYERIFSMYWQRRSAIYEHALLRSGVEPPPVEPPPSPHAPR